MPVIPAPPPDMPQVSGNKSANKKQQSKHTLTSNYNNNNGLSPNKSSGTESSSSSSSKNTTPSHPTTQTDRTLLEASPTPKPSPVTQTAPQADAGDKEKVWERCWTLSELKSGSADWTLAGDAGLLKYVTFLIDAATM